MGDDLTRGGAGSDILLSGAGADTLDGGADADQVWGGTGADQFRYAAASGSAAAQRDTLYDFSQAEGDRIDLSLIDANPNLGGDQAFSWIGTTAFSGAGAPGRLRDAQGSTTVIEADINGDGTADLVINLAGSYALTQADFIL